MAEENSVTLTSDDWSAMATRMNWAADALEASERGTEPYYRDRIQELRGHAVQLRRSLTQRPFGGDSEEE